MAWNPPVQLPFLPGNIMHYPVRNGGRCGDATQGPRRWRSPLAAFVLAALAALAVRCLIALQTRSPDPPDLPRLIPTHPPPPQEEDARPRRQVCQYREGVAVLLDAVRCSS